MSEDIVIPDEPFDFMTEIFRLKSELVKERARSNQFFDGMTKAEAELDEQRKYISCLEGNVEDTKELEAQVASLKAHADMLAGTLEDIKPYIQDQYCRGKIQEAQDLYRKEIVE